MLSFQFSSAFIEIISAWKICANINTDKTGIQTFLETFSDAQLKTERTQVSGLCIFCISLLFLQPKISLNLLVNFTQILHLAERYERYGCKSGEGPYSTLTEEWPEELSPTWPCSGLAAAEAQRKLDSWQRFSSRTSTHNTHHNSCHMKSFVPSQQPKPKGI